MSSRCFQLGGLVVVVLLLSGCFGDAVSIQVAEDAVVAGWTHDTKDDRHEAAGGRVEVILNGYAKDGDLQGELFLVSVSDVPFVNERKHVREQVLEQAESSGVKMEQTRTFKTELDNGKSVTITEYEIEKESATTTVSGIAWVALWSGSGFQGGAIAWATTEYSTLLGGERDESVWEEAQTMLRAADW